MKYTYIIIGMLAASLFISSCSRGQQDGSGSTTDAVSENNKIQSVEVVKPQKRSFIAEILITGTARPNQKVTLYAMESGYVKNIFMDIGDMVSKGEVVAELANPELVRQYEQKKAQLKAKKSIYERLKSIHEKTPAITPLQLVENAEAEYFSVNASLNAIKDRMNFLSVKAPFTGKITKRLVDHGALVQSGLTEDNPQGIFELQEISLIRLTIPLPESDVTAIGKGMDVTVTFPELPGESFQAKVSRTAGALDPASKTMQVEIDIDNPNGFIKPGMYAKVLMQISRRDSVLSLPVTAQWIFQNLPFVLIVKDGKVERVPLRKGLSNKDYFEVLNPEITESALVIVQGKGLVQPGQIVKPVLKIK
ncbi:MAG: efflux RND transporter periplasmic adaptor subunit [Candidatus Scalindua sp.]